MISEQTIDILCNWYIANYDAAENSSLLVKSNNYTPEESQQITDFCCQRMAACSKAEIQLDELKKLSAAGLMDEVPELLKLFAKAEKDKGCNKCWISSRSSKQHPECKAKMRVYWGYKAALMAYIYEVYVKHRMRESL